MQQGRRSRRGVLAILILLAAALQAAPGQAIASRGASRPASLQAAPGARAAGRQRAEAPRVRTPLSVRATGRFLRGVQRTVLVPERSWNDHPGIRAAISRHLGAGGRSVQRGEFDVRAVYDGTRLTGYTIHAATRDYGGQVRSTVLHLDPSGAQVKQTGVRDGAVPAAVRLTRGAGLGRAAGEERGQTIARWLSKLPGARVIARWRTGRIERRKALIAEYRAENDIDTVLKDQAADPHIAEVASYTHHPDSVVYAVSDLHASTGPGNVTEDLRAGSAAMARWLRGIEAGGSQRATLVCGGDCLEFMENVPHDASDAELEAMATRIIEGHADLYRGLARAVVPGRAGQPDRGLRVIFTAGNHDIQMVKKPMRDHLVREMARVGGLRGEEVALFRQRVAFTGEMAVLGKKGEMVVLHGHQHDPTNNWRENMNPNRYVVSRGGPLKVLRSLVTTGRLPPLRVSRAIEANMGYTIVQRFWNYVERRVPGAENGGKSSMHAAGKGLLGSPRNILRLGRVLWVLLGQNKGHTAATIEATRADDHATALAWAERTRAHELWGLSGPEEVVRRMDVIQAQMPRPVHERMTSALRTVNLLRLLFGGARRIHRERNHAEPLLLELLTSELPNVRDISLGHTHDQARLVGHVAGRGEVVYRNTGTWTTSKGKDVFTVAVSRMENGSLVEKGLFRYDHAADRLIAQRSPPRPDFTPPRSWSPAAVPVLAASGAE